MAEDLAINYRAVDDLIPYARNARTHSPSQVALIAGSIREFGWTNPVLVDGENGIIAGHGRVLAARQLGLKLVQVIELSHLTAAQKRAYVLADNKLAEQAGWDKDLLALEPGELADLGIDLGTLGFETTEIDALLRNGGSRRHRGLASQQCSPMAMLTRAGRSSSRSSTRAMTACCGTRSAIRSIAIPT